MSNFSEFLMKTFIPPPSRVITTFLTPRKGLRFWTLNAEIGELRSGGVAMNDADLAELITGMGPIKHHVIRLKDGVTSIVLGMTADEISFVDASVEYDPIDGVEVVYVSELKFIDVHIALSLTDLGFARYLIATY